MGASQTQDMNSRDGGSVTTSDKIMAKEATGELGRSPAKENSSNSSTTIDEEVHEDTEVASIAESIGNQRKLLSKKQLLIAFPALAVCLFVSFIDQTSVSTCIPAISAELNTGGATSWIGASFLIASVAFQLINGRLSDIFGRKHVLLTSLLLMAVGDLLTGFAKTATQLFAFRAIAGIGGGGINSIVMIIVSDIVSLADRGKYQGILGAVLALANGTGPFIGGVLVEKASWRWVFWIIPMLAMPAALAIIFFLPLAYEKGNYLAKAKKIDFGGIVINLAGVLLILIPLTGGGVTYAWNSVQLIVMLVIGGLLSIAFVLYEWKLARYPLMPLRLYQAPHCSYLYGQSFFSGVNFYGNFFYVPIYLQSARGYSALESGALLLPLVILTSILSISVGQYMSRYHRYLPPVGVGFVFWMLGTGLRCMFSQTLPLGGIIPILMIEGAGIGMTLQPTLVGLYANSRTEDRAVVTGLRNFMRTMGGAFGLVGAGAILSNTLNKELSGYPFAQGRTLSELDVDDVPDEDKPAVRKAYMKALHWIFIFYACSSAISVILTVGIGNKSLKTNAKTPKTEPTKRDDDLDEGVVRGEGTVASKEESSDSEKKQEGV